jgi:hypothetical protein
MIGERRSVQELIRMKRKRSCVALVLGGILGTALGCARDVSNRAVVKGTIMIDGAPLPTGSIDFIPMDKRGQPGGAAIEKGHYEISADKGLFAGDYKVQVQAQRPTGKKVWDGMGDERAPASKKNYVNVMESYIPAKYNNQSTLTATIEVDKVNECNFDIQLDKK